MKGKVRFAKFPVGVYYCQIEDIKAGINSKGEDIIIVSYRIQEGERAGQTFKERLNSVSTMFLKGIGEPCGYEAEWDTERWRNKFVWVDVKYSPDEQQWPRYGHHAQKPEFSEDYPQPKGIPAGRTEVDDIPF